jgi:hypothetical protein
MKKLFILFFMLVLSSLSFSQDILPKAKLPVLTTSAGQSADVNTLNAVMDQAEIGYDYCDVPTVDMLKAGVGLGGRISSEGFHVEILTDLDSFAEGTPYKTVIFAIGASLKGMGASGLTVEKELKRLETLIQYCKKNKIFIIAVHSGGESTRGPAGSDNERMIDAVAPFSDYIIIVENSNKDGRFSKISKEKGIPLSQVKYALDVVDLLQKVF